MAYPSDLPTAGPHELAAAYASDDPVEFIARHVDALTHMRTWVEGELAKWEGARATYAQFRAGQIQEGGDVPDITEDPTDDRAQGEAPSAIGFHERPATRRAGITILFQEHPGRRWRTRDLADEMMRRGWSPRSANEGNKVSRILTAMTMDNEIVNVHKGVYMLRAQQEDARPRTLEEAIT